METPEKSKKSFFSPSVLLPGIPAVLLFIYVFIRAKLISLNWDEAFTFFEFVRHSSWLPHDFNYMAANNHLLNTWLMKCSVTFFGESEIALRLPNVIASAFFFYYLIRTMRLLFVRSLPVTFAFLVVALNPFLLDFFSMARGYGISMAFLSAAIYQLTVYFLKEQTMYRAVRVQTLLMFAVLANLTMIHLLLVSSLLLMIIHWRQQNRVMRFREVFQLSLVPLLVVGSLGYYFYKLAKCGAFFFGSEEQSLFGTVSSLAKASSYGFPNGNWVAQTFFYFSVLSPLVLVLFMPSKSKGERDPRKVWANFIFFLAGIVFLMPLFQHLILGSNYLSGRTALYLIPFFSFLFIGITFYLPRGWGNLMLILPLAFFAVNFYYAYNLKYSFDFREQADVKEAMHELKKQNPPVAENLFANVFCTNLPYDAQANYYKMRFGIENFGHILRYVELPGASWYYLNDKEAKEKKSIQLVRYFPQTKTGLYKGTDTTKYKILVESWDDFEGYGKIAQIGTGEPFIGKKGTKAGGGGNGRLSYSVFSRLERIDTMTVQPIAASIGFRLNTSSRNVGGLFVFQAITDTSSTWQSMHMSELSVKNGEWSLSGWTEPIPAGTKEVRVCLWNESDALIYMDNVSIRLLAKE